MPTLPNNGPGPGFRLTRGWILRVAGSAVILAGLLWYLPTEKVWSGLAAVGPELFLAVLALFVAGHVVAAAKWLGLLGFGFPFFVALRAHFAGLAANLFLPGVAGGDVVRAGIVAGHKSLADLTAGSLGDRLVDMLALALLTVMGVMMLRDGTHAGLALEVAGLFIVAILGAFYVAPIVARRLLRAVPGLPMRGMVAKMAQAFGDLGRRPMALVAALAVSLSIQGGFVMLTVWLARATGIDVPLGAWFFAWPLAKIISVLPISLGGIGVREASLSALMVPFGADAASVVAASLIWQVVLVCGGILGALLWVMSPARHGKVV